ncbi:MAG: DUF5702 domain-containing protein [Clostridiales Family XIII bacterium]|jgi:hypothetical protein|nr:DUF5702 domain-containing protein [Clostridiales Family XIII bacterium]
MVARMVKLARNRLAPAAEGRPPRPGFYALLRTDERGSAIVLITVLFACLIGLTTVVFAASKAAAGRSCADAAFRLAGRSVLSEYDTRLLDDYGILAFKGDEKQIEKDLAFYADAALTGDTSGYAQFVPLNGGSRLIRLNTNYTASLKQFSLLDVTVFENQLKAAAVKKVISSALPSGADAGTGFGATEGEPETERTLRNESVKDALPSAGYTDAGFLGISLANWTSFFELSGSALTKIETDEYILSVFGNANDGVYAPERFFANETEYIIAGKDGDTANYSAVKTSITTMRALMNNAALLADSKKRAIIQELATPFAAAGGIGEAVAFVIITEAWVAAETRNDTMLLEEGGRVAFFKNSRQWATDNIEEIVDGFTADEPVYPADTGGLSYRDHLRALLYLTDRETKLLRVMDLLQINLKTDYDRDFLLREYYTGFRFTAQAGGDEFAYTETY